MVKLFGKNSNLCDHNPPTLHTDRRTDDRNTALCTKVHRAVKIITIDFDDIWQKYSKDSRIGFVCFNFHVGLLVVTLSSLKSNCIPKIHVHAVRFSQPLSEPFLAELETQIFVNNPRTDDRWILFMPHVKFL